MLGLLVGFYVSEDVRLPVVINACLGVAIALGMSGVRNAYISKAAEWPRSSLSARDDRPPKHQRSSTAGGNAFRLMLLVGKKFGRK